jgi:RNA polymerase sigma-70 factor, ECF subfamily
MEPLENSVRLVLRGILVVKGKRTPVTGEDFDTIYEEQADYVYSLSRRLSKTRSDAEDLFQEAFLKAYRFLPKFRGGSVKGWLRRIVINTNISSHRGLKNQPTLPLDEKPGWKESIPDDSAGPQKIAEQTEAKQRLQDALAELTEDARTVLVLREIEGLNYSEISEALEVPKGTVRSRLARARESLRAVLEGRDG